MCARTTAAACFDRCSPCAYVSCGGKTHRLPGPLALVQTDKSDGQQEITHVNGLSLSHLAATCPEVPADHALLSGFTGLLTTVSRGGVTVQALAVVAVHAALLAPASASASASPQQKEAAEQPRQASEHRSLMRAATRLTWGLAGLVYELMEGQVGLWPTLPDPVDRQAVAGATLTQLYGLNRNLALAVLRAYGQLTPAMLAEMLEHGLLPAPTHRAPIGAAAAAPGPISSDGDMDCCEDSCSTGSSRIGTPAGAEWQQPQQQEGASSSRQVEEASVRAG